MIPQLHRITYCFASSNDSSGVFNSLKTAGEKMIIRTVNTRAAAPKIDSVVPMVFFTSTFAFIPVYFPTMMVPPSVRPVIMLVMICVTCVPVETAATLSGVQYLPITSRSTAPYSA